MFAIVREGGVGAFCVCVGIALAGCNVDGRWTKFRSIEPPPAVPADRAGAGGADLALADGREADLVEEMTAARNRYLQTLHELRRFYEEHGYATKSHWTKLELQGLAAVKQFRYLGDTEVPSNRLRPESQIPEADALYQKGLSYMRRGGRGLGVIHREDRMIEAAQIFRDMIERYPTSDKIDDAAFQCGEIHSKYLPGQEPVAVKWYERAWTWNPLTSYPARFEAATIYDYRLHNRDRALELYHAAMEQEAAYKSNARFAARRIEELTGIQTTATPPPKQTPYGSPQP